MEKVKRSWDAEWRLQDTRMIDLVRQKLKPLHVILFFIVVIMIPDTAYKMAKAEAQRKSEFFTISEEKNMRYSQYTRT